MRDELKKYINFKIFSRQKKIAIKKIKFDIKKAKS
jgi:hypothetical protein